MNENWNFDSAEDVHLLLCRWQRIHEHHIVLALPSRIPSIGMREGSGWEVEGVAELGKLIIVHKDLYQSRSYLSLFLIYI